jgi:hypothetical protein
MLLKILSGIRIKSCIVFCVHYFLSTIKKFKKHLNPYSDMYPNFISIFYKYTERVFSLPFMNINMLNTKRTRKI